MEKPKKPIEPNTKHYQYPKYQNGKNFLDEPIYQRLDYIQNYKQYQKDLEKYNVDIEVYEQLKLIRLIKNATEKYCLKKLKISKR